MRSRKPTSPTSSTSNTNRRGAPAIWLSERIAELRNQSNTAARAVENYKEKNNIVDTGARGLLSDLQVQELNSQMITATAATAEAKARLDRVEEVLKSPAPGEAVGTVTDTLHNEVITKLRQRYLTDREHVAKWTAKVGPTTRCRDQPAKRNEGVAELDRGRTAAHRPDLQERLRDRQGA